MTIASNELTTGMTMLSAKSALPARAVRAHALRNCLQIIHAVNSLLGPELGGAWRCRLSRSQNAVRRMVALIEEEFLADGEPQSQGEARYVSAAQVFDAVATRVEDLAQAKQIRLQFQIGNGGLCGDADQLSEALGNIATNAIESSSTGSTVTVSSSETTDGGQLWTVRDAGHGIPRECFSKLGTPFFSRRAGGTGLGIAMARDVIERHGGLAHIESSLGGGTLVSIWLPSTRR